MKDLIQIIISLIGGGVVGQLLNLIFSRKKRKTEGIETYSETIDRLLESNSKLIQEQIKLREQIAKLSVQSPIHNPISVHNPLYMRRRCRPLKTKDNKDKQDESVQNIDAPDEPP